MHTSAGLILDAIEEFPQRKHDLFFGLIDKDNLLPVYEYYNITMS